jgi:serralysin
MSDLTLSGFDRYFWSQEYHAEYYGGVSLSTVLARAGTAGNDVLNGAGGMDGFHGMAGNDTIDGGGGNDLIDGGAGKDRMTGGAGRDIFDFDSPGETGALFTTRDVITDFTPGVDIIDLSGMDASTVLSGPGDFHGFMWLGNAPQFVGPPMGEVRYAWFDNAGTDNDYTVLYGDTDSDLGCEFQIEFRGLHSFDERDFYL